MQKLNKFKKKKTVIASLLFICFCLEIYSEILDRKG